MQELAIHSISATPATAVKGSAATGKGSAAAEGSDVTLVYERGAASEQARHFDKQAITNATERMHSSGESISILMSCHTGTPMPLGISAGVVSNGQPTSPPTSRSLRDAWDQPVRVSSLELAFALGLEDEINDLWGTPRVGDITLMPAGAPAPAPPGGGRKGRRGMADLQRGAAMPSDRRCLAASLLPRCCLAASRIHCSSRPPELVWELVRPS